MHGTLLERSRAVLSETDLIFGVELVYLELIELPAEYMSWWGSGPRHLKILMV